MLTLTLMGIDLKLNTHKVDTSSYFSSKSSTAGVTKVCGMYYPVCGMVHIKGPLLLIGKYNRWQQVSSLAI